MFFIFFFSMLPETKGYLYVGQMETPFSVMKVNMHNYEICSNEGKHAQLRNVQ